MPLRSRALPAVAATALVMSTLLLLPGSPASGADPRETFSQPQPIELNDDEARFEQPTGLTIPDAGSATAYPSQITVDHGGLVTHIEEVTISGLTHGRPDDLDIMLVGPTGVSVVLMSDSGGDNDLDNVFLRFVDPSFFGQSLPDEDPIEGEDFYPTDNGTGDDTFPDPAPAPSDATDFSAFVDTPAAGTWSLYVVDDTTGEAGEIDEWSMEIGLTGTNYPSELEVSGLGTVTDVDVVIHDFSTGCADDVDLLLVGPQGEMTAVLSDAGGCRDEAVDGVDLRFDDESLHTASQSQPLGTDDSYQPTDYDGDENDEDADEYPLPAPDPGPGGEPSTLSVFDGTDPNGTWQLFAHDDVGEFLTRIEGGWSLDIAWADQAAPSGSVVLNDGARLTRKRDVSVRLSVTDPAPSSATEVRLSPNGVFWKAWQPIDAELVTDWRLSPINGRQGVYAQFRDAAGNTSAIKRDTIILDTVAPRATLTTPAAGATNVARGADIRVRASEKLAPPLTVGGVLLIRGGVPIPVELRLAERGRVIVIDPVTPLKPGSYVAVVRPRVRDLAGNRWDQKPTAGTQPLKVPFRV